MLEQMRILSARRAYEFDGDDLRVTYLSTPPVTNAIKQALQFQIAAVGSPIPTFGPVPNTFPAGFVFDIGAVVPSDGMIIPVRFLHFEPRRVVVDVLGSSEVIDSIWDLVQQITAQISTPDAVPIIGKPAKVLDYSEITFRFPGSLDALLPRHVARIVRSLDTGEKQNTRAVVPALTFQVQLSTTEYATLTPGSPDVNAFKLSLRDATRPEEGILWSAAPLSTTAHVAYLEQIVESLLSTS